MYPPAAPVSDIFTDTEAHARPRAEALAHLRQTLGSGRASIRRHFESRELSGVEAAHALATLTDNIIASLAEYAGLAQEEMNERFCLCATGGYGAGLLAPFSDVDLLFLTEEPPSQTLRQQIEYVLYTLWDLGLRIGHATRSLRECLDAAQSDLTICTALLDVRPVYGVADLPQQLRRTLKAHLTDDSLQNFIHAKIEEREKRHHRFGDTPYLVEPHLKEGRGGLRDLQTLNWMGRATLGQLVSVSDPLRHELGLAPACVLLGLLTKRKTYRAQKVWNFLWTVRLHLHYITGRAEERLTFDVQPILGARMGYAHHGHQRAVERFMRHYFLMARTVMRLTHVLQPAILLHVQNQRAGCPPHIEAGPETFQRVNGCLCTTDQSIFTQDPRTIFRLLDCARRYQLELHPSTVQQLIHYERYSASLRNDAETSELFLTLLCDPATLKEAPSKERRFWLPILNETGLLSRLVPGWSRILGLMQFDGYHIYTVDEHTIEAVRILRQIEAGYMADEVPVAYSIARSLQTRHTLYIATLLHDLGKGRGGDHSEIGANLVLPICKQLGLDADEADVVSWLVAHHVLLSNTAFTRDIDDPQTIFDIADTIQSPERLRLLLLLTIADIRAVGPRAWNAWKATLLHRLYSRVADVLDGGLQTSEDDVRVNNTRVHLQKALAPLLPEENINNFLHLGKPGYWLGFDTATHIRHAQLIRNHLTADEPQHITISLDSLPGRGISELTVLCADRPGIFALIAGALAIHGASIADARIHTLNNGMVLDSFWIQNIQGNAFEEEADIRQLKEGIRAVLTTTTNLPEALASVTPPLTRRMEALHIPSHVVIDNNASERATVIEVNGRDRPALLHDITRSLGQEATIISSAHITTYGLRAVDVFYIHDAKGQKITDPAKLASLRLALLRAL